MTDKRFEADGIAAYCRRFLSSGVWELGDNLKVSAADGMKISIGYGYALINGYLFGIVDNETGPLQLTADDANTQSRIDRVVCIADANTQRIYAYIKKGTPSSTPEAPPVNANEISLSQFLITAGLSQISAANITDERADDTVCGLVKQNRYDIGEIYISTKSTSPAIKYGGVWTRIKDVFPLFAGDTWAAGTTGGSRYLQSHTHVQYAHTHTQEAHKHYRGDINANASPSNPGAAIASGGTSVFYSNNGTGFTADAGGTSFSTPIIQSTIAVNQNAGNGNAENIPPFKAFYAWERVA